MAVDDRDPIARPGDAKIVMASSANGVTWTAPAAVSEPSQPGHQIMPSLAFAGGKLLLVYYDLREDVSEVYGPYIDDRSAALSSGKRHTVDIRASLGGIEHCEVQAERRVSRGGAVVRTPEGDVDARVETKLVRAREVIEAALSNSSGV